MRTDRHAPLRVFLRILLLAATQCTGFGASAQAPQRRPLDVQDVNRIAELSAPAASADGRWIAYGVSTPDPATNKNQTSIWVRAWDGRSAREFKGPGGHGAVAPAFLPDGSALAYLADAGDGHDVQVWLQPLSGGDPRQVTTLAGGVSDFVLAPDGNRLVAVAPFPGNADGGDGAPIVIDRFLFKDDDRGYLGARRQHLFVVPMSGGPPTQITHGDFDAALPAWSPDGRRIVYVSRHAEEQGHPLGYDLYCIDALSGANEVRISTAGRVNNDPDHLSRPAWAPDSGSVAYIQGGAEKWLEYAPWELVVADLATAQVRRVGRADLGYTHPAYTSDGKGLLALVEENRNTYLARIDLDGAGERKLTRGKRFDFDLAAGPDGRIALISGDDSHPYRLSVIGTSGDAPAETILPGHNDWLDAVALQAVEDTEFSSPDGTRIEGFLVRPQGYQPGRRYPTVVSVHGGPQYQFSHEFMFDWQLYATKGYLVVGVNPRGSSGRGFDFSRAIAADWGHVDVEDVLAGTDHAVALGLADPQRLAVGGWSYGGYLTDFIIASTGRFKAAVSGAGSGNALAMYGGDEYTSWLELEMGTPWKNLDTYLRVSYPFLHSDRITTPTLFLCGQIDFNVPCIGSEQMYQALRSNRVPSRLVVYPNMHHSPDTPAFTQDRIARFLDWFDRYLKAP
jgi:dipeptidyl aminopeptidase/acylaminoacyl peptidase